jgi:putative PEP-CTERM system histidine kinase
MVDSQVNSIGESWSNAALVVGVIAAVAIAGIILVSRTVRGRTRIFITKTFFRYKYDYRKEWLRFIGILSQAGLEHVPRTAVRAVAPIVNSPGGIVWTQENEDDDFIPVGAWRCDLTTGQSISDKSSLIGFLRDREWVIDLNELKSHPRRYGDLKLDAWFSERNEFWLVVPLLMGDRLIGIITLLKPKVMPQLNFEDHDLLKTVGRHVATHIKQAESDKRLAESSQFGTYHRLSAFLMHDMNNLIAQQSLVVKNAETLRHDPKFVDDTIETIAHSVARMRRLMEQLSRDSKVPARTSVRLRDAVERAVKRSKPREPAPSVKFDCGDVYLNADPERLTVIIEHLISNAQDATRQDGRIEISAYEDDGVAVISISDTGCGMSPEFISERLFRPFDSTKSSNSMGIGAYQAREYARMLGGHLEVRSHVGEGTTFSLRLPVFAGNEADQ